ncbi:MAG: DUF7684 family protein [Thermoleophilia bacterium]
MIKINNLGMNKATNRELFAVHLNNAGELDEKLDLTSRYFVCFLCWDDSTNDTRDAISNFAEILLRSGGVYFCVWGKGCSRVHDIIDLASYEQGQENESVIMTSWHEDESLDDALWFFLNSAFPDDRYFDECRAGVAITIGSNSESVARVDFALKFSEEFSTQVLHKKDI